MAHDSEVVVTASVDRLIHEPARLAIIASFNGIGIGNDNISLLTQLLPKCSIVKWFFEKITRRVIDILYIGVYSDFLVGLLSRHRSAY